MHNVYFANLPKQEIGKVLLEKVENYYESVEKIGRLSLWRKAYRAYYNLDTYGKHKGSEIGRTGAQGELHQLSANHFRNLLQHLHVLVTQQKPTFECRAVNTDHKSQIQTILGTNVLEYYMREKRLSEHFRKAVEFAVLYGEAYISAEYDHESGDVAGIDPDTGEVVRTGDVVCRVHGPMDVIRRIRSDSDTNQDWYIIRRYENKYNLAAKASDPEVINEILGSGDEEVVEHFAMFMDKQLVDNDDDIIPVYYFVHDRNSACKEGKEVLFLSSGTVIDFKDLSYDCMPIKKMAAYTQDGTSFGYSVSFDLLGVQEAIDAIYSIITTNQMTFGVQNVWVKPGANISVSQVVDGLNFIQSNEKPESINLTNTPAEIFNFLNGLEGLGETLSGVNSVARGQPEASLKSGSALALVASQAVQFSNGIQASYVQLLEDVGTLVLKMLQQYAAIPRIAAIAGSNRRTQVKEFTGEDLKSINRVIVDVGSPISQTMAGKIELANNLLQQGLIKQPEQYIQVMSTGRLEHITDDDETENLLIQLENEALRNGEQVPALAVDQHVAHIRKHRATLADPAARKDPKIVKATLDHLQEHVNLLSTVNPNLLNLLGMNPLSQQPSDVAGANAPQPNAQPPQGGPPAEGGPAAPGQQVQAPPNMDPAMAEQLPIMPTPAGQ